MLPQHLHLSIGQKGREDNYGDKDDVHNLFWHFFSLIRVLVFESHLFVAHPLSLLTPSQEIIIKSSIKALKTLAFKAINMGK